MANQEHLDILKQGVEVWNKWREEHPDIQPDLKEANLRGIQLSGSNLRNTNFQGADLIVATLDSADLIKANLSRAYLIGASLREARLIDAKLRGCDLSAAKLIGADLRKVTLCSANLSEADLSGANLSDANLSFSNFSEANCHNANLTGCRIYAISAWNVRLNQTIQTDLIITPPNEATITVDNLEVAQFIYLLLNNKKIRDVIDTITSKVVLILGRFTPERKAILDALRDALRQHEYLPILFDFEKPASRDITETISTLAHLARFVIADITDAKSIPQELMAIVPNLPSVAVQPLILASQHEYGMFEHFRRYPWVLPIYRYSDEVSLLEALQEKVIAPARMKAEELAKR